MTLTLSTRAFKFLRKINRKSGLQNTDEEIHDIGMRLLSLCHIAAEVKDREEKALQNSLTEGEIKALHALSEHFLATGRLSSARELAYALGYRSSRSGHLLLQRLLCKGVLTKRAGHLVFGREYERRLERQGESPVPERHSGKDGNGDLPLDFRSGGGE
jgi:hypothetical protein